MTIDRSLTRTKSGKSILAAAVVCAIGIAGASHSQAAIINWDGSASTAWATGTNWVGDAAPANNVNDDIATFNLPTYGGPVFSPNTGTASVKGLDIKATNGSMTLAGTSLTVGAGDIVVASNSNTTITTTLAGSADLIKSGTGTLVLTKYNTFTGAVIVNSGTLELAEATSTPAGATGGSGIASASSITINNGGTLRVLRGRGNNVGPEGNGVNRIGDTVGVTLNGGALVVDSSTDRTKEVIGTLSLASGASKIGFTNTGGISTLRTTDIDRAGGTTLLVQGTSATSVGDTAIAGGKQYVVIDDTTGLLVGGGGAAGNALISIVPYAVYGASSSDNGTNFLTYVTTATTGTTTNASTIRALRPLAGAEISSTFANGSTNLHNVRLVNTAITGIDSPTTINALNLTGSGGVSGAGTLTIHSGAILATSTSTAGLSVNTLAFGTREAIIHSVAALNISSNITGSGGITKSSAGTLTLAGTSSNTGDTTVNQGTLTVDGSLANSTINILSGATLNGSGTLNYNLANDAADLITVNGTLDITNLDFVLNLTGSQSFSEYIVADYTGGTLVGTEFASVTLPSGWALDYDGTTNNAGNYIVLVNEENPIPEPASLSVLALGGLALLIRRRNA